MSQRTDRIDELLRQEIGAILAREISDPRIGFATVTEIETTPDLRHARVWISVIGQKGEREQTITALDHAMGYVRRELGSRLRLKRIPELHVRLDDSIERGTRVLHLISELEAGHEPDSLPEGESLPTPVARIPQAGDAPEPESPDGEDGSDVAAGPAALAGGRLEARRPRRNGPRGATGSRALGRPNARPRRHRP